MPRCRKCGKRGIFLRLTPDGLCSECNNTHGKILSDSKKRVIHQSDFATITVEASLSVRDVEVRQKTRGDLPAIPLDAWDGYTSPSGGFVNYGRFQVVGKNPATNRKNKRTYEVRDEEAARKCAEGSGLVGPFDVTVLPSLPPSEAQLSYVKDLGATVPNGACKADVSAIISRITDDDEAPVSENLARLAHAHGIKISRFSGKRVIMRLARDLPTSDYMKFVRAM